MHQCKALNFQIVEEKPVNAKLDFQGEIITTGAVSEEAIADAVDKYFEKNPVIVEEIDPTIYQWAKQPNKPKYTADEIEGVLTIEDKISLEDKIKEVEESGIDGKSAYEIAVGKGFEGTEEEWLESLKGAIGEPGNDYILTEEDKEEIANKVTIPAPEVNIPEWAQQETKPQYTAEEVGAAYSIVELSRKPKSAPEQELELKGKVGQFGIYKEGNRVDFYRCVSVTKHSQYGNTFIYEWEYLGTNSNCEYIPYSPNLNYSGGAKLSGNMVYSDSSSGKALYIRVSENKPLVKISLATDIVISVDENSTDDQIPSAKLFYDTIGNIETALDSIIAIQERTIDIQENLIGGATE